MSTFLGRALGAGASRQRGLMSRTPGGAPTVAACRTGGHMQHGATAPQLTRSPVPPTPKEGDSANSRAVRCRNEPFFFTSVLVNAVAPSALLVGSTLGWTASSANKPASGSSCGTAVPSEPSLASSPSPWRAQWKNRCVAFSRCSPPSPLWLGDPRSVLQCPYFWLSLSQQGGDSC